MDFPLLPAEYLREAETIPAFWITSLEDIAGWLKSNVTRGEVREMGRSAGGRPILRVAYGHPRQSGRTTTFSGAIGARKLAAAFGPEHERRVYLAMGGVHASEYEGIMGIVNLIAVLETGSDLRGKAWPELAELGRRIDRLVLIPVLNVDGRARIPQRMFPHRGTDSTVYQCFATGAWADGKNIGWPQCKEFIPLDFAKTMFPGGYPNDAGVNIQHDDFLSPDRQPETEALLRLCAEERPDLTVNLHTGAPPNNYFCRMHRPFFEPALRPVFDRLYAAVHGGLARAGLQSTTDPELEGDPTKVPQGVYNLDTAINLHCGALTCLIESPCHSFTGKDRAGNPVFPDPGLLLDQQLVCHREALRFLLETGGRCVWTPEGK
ncbi:MAG: M14 family zinc carboxypeptidase [Lentisphaeria bacterium]|jgi:hypothetical protein|nr:M14 family zinc carboxypeptidase [Lentisphaeria bacterium]